jgi:hypothetical protein
MKIHQITQEAVRDVVSDALQGVIGRGMIYSAERAAALTGLDKRSIWKYVCGDTTPPMDSALRLTMLPKGGVILANALMGMTGCCVVPIFNGDPNPWHINRDLAGAVAELAAALADGRIDHTEDPGWCRKAREVGHALIAHANAREAADQ